MRVVKHTKDTDLDLVLNRGQDESSPVEETVREIINNVRTGGDSALYEYARTFDRADLEDLRVSSEEIEQALESVDGGLLAIYEEAAANIRDFHEKQLETTWSYSPREGVMLGQQITPIEEVGIYVPGGKAAYPSTVLMDAVPAMVAGVKRVAMVTPPGADGQVDPHILAAAHIAGVDEIYKVGGAQAIAALAYGTETIRPVSKIVGPGNIYVATAKKEVFGKVDIDMIAGPSEVLVIADNSANPSHVAADLLAQAEHDPLATPILVTTSPELANEVISAMERQLKEDITREEIARQSEENQGIVFLVGSVDEAIDLANEIAPEHLELNIEDAGERVGDVKNAGAIFIGANTPEPVGDYFAGPNHTLPTSGTAKFSSPLGVYDFLKRTSLLCYSKDALAEIQEKVIQFAESEGLDAHANSIRVRTGDEK